MPARKPLGVATCADQIAAILDARGARLEAAQAAADIAVDTRIQSEILKLAKLVPAAERSKIAPVLAAMGRELGGFAVEEAVAVEGAAEAGGVPAALMEELSPARLALGRGR